MNPRIPDCLDDRSDEAGDRETSLERDVALAPLVPLTEQAPAVSVEDALLDEINPRYPWA